MWNISWGWFQSCGTTAACHGLSHDRKKSAQELFMLLEWMSQHHISQILSMCHGCWVTWASTGQELWNQPKYSGLRQGLICKILIRQSWLCCWVKFVTRVSEIQPNPRSAEALAGEASQEDIARALRARFARKAAKSKRPLVKKSVSKRTGKLQVSMS